MKASQLFLRAIAKYAFNFPKFNRPILQKTVLSTGLLTYGLWYSSSKIFNEELQVFETEDNLKDGEIREIQVGPEITDTILVINHQGTIYSTQGQCSHFGFALAKGTLVGDKIICPLHNAGFSIKSGLPDQGPVFDGLKTFTVERVDGKIKVSVPKIGWNSKPAPIEIGKQNVDQSKQIVIIGAGPSALSAAETLRKTGYKGVIYMITKQKYLPYDRTMLTKGMDGTKPPGPIRSAESFANNGIVILQESTVTGIDYEAKKVIIKEQEPLKFDKLLIASGLVNRVPPIKGLTQTKYHTIRNISDYKLISESIRAEGVKNITIIGGGFIGMEIASAIKLTLKDANVTVLSNQIPLARVLGPKVGSVLQKLSEKNGVKVHSEVQVKEIKGTPQRPTEVVLDGKNIPTDVLIVATGATCATQFAKELLDSTGQAIKTNVFLETSKPDIYASGDIASYPYWYTGQHTRIQHYNEAIYQGSVAGLNMAGKKYPMDNIPFFWTRQFNNSLVFTGVNNGWDDIHVDGDLNEMKFVAYYIRKSDDMVLGAAAMNSMNKIQIINEAMKNGVMPKGTAVKATGFKLEDLLKEIKKKDPKCAKCTMCQ